MELASRSRYPTGLEYIYTVFDALSRAETESDITDIRRELYSGYASRMKNYVAARPQKPKPMVSRHRRI